MRATILPRGEKIPFLSEIDKSHYICKPNGRFMNDTKEHILKTSLLLFLQKSYRDVTMREIVEKTGLSKGAFYHYFASKEELFKEIANMFLSKGAINYSSFSKDSLQTFYRQYIEFLNNSLLEMSNMVAESGNKSFNLNFFLILFEGVGRFPEFLKMELALHMKDVEAWKDIIAFARKQGEITSGTTDEEIANLFLYCTDGVFLRFINSDKPRAFKDFLSNAYDTIYENLKT
jgi:TetR/AcrR family transcriptional regulator, transcriptional repressor for nem operon